MLSQMNYCAVQRSYCTASNNCTEMRFSSFSVDSTTVANMNSPDKKPVNPHLCEVQQCFFVSAVIPP